MKKERKKLNVGDRVRFFGCGMNTDNCNAVYSNHEWNVSEIDPSSILSVKLQNGLDFCMIDRRQVTKVWRKKKHIKLGSTFYIVRDRVFVDKKYAESVAGTFGLSCDAMITVREVLE